ncbi:MAG: amidohydrolase family protein, partial [Pseudomonadota bacterium]|nr:amidohydrolase family protein [Pseudomonadota bacterium]
GICRERGIPLASHDDATTEHVEESAGFGMSIAEFPTTLEAAKESHQRGMMVMMGAPNVVRGGSHSGNIAAATLAEEGVLDILSSDYYPASMLDAAFRLARLETNDYDLTRAIATVTAIPARCAGLDDRGSIAAGKRADLVLVSECKEQPVIESVWRAGNRVY